MFRRHDTNCSTRRHNMAVSQNLVDVPFALSQLGGNSDLLQRMLQKFKNEFISVPSDVKTFLNADNLKEAKLKVHTTKGLSGNLGLMALFECSKKLDQQMRENQIDAALLDTFDALMKDTCQFIDTIDLETKVAPEFSQTMAKQSHKQLFLERLKRHEFIDDKTLHMYADSLHLTVEVKRELVALVEELQYAKAIDIINASQ